jgi:hypothetical protein
MKLSIYLVRAYPMEQYQPQLKPNQQSRPCFKRRNKKSEHTLLLILWLISCIWTIGSNHLLCLLTYAHPLYDLQILHSAKDVMLDTELDLHPECGTFLDCEWVLL